MSDDERLAPDDPRRLGEYVLIGRLGEGGQGVVYLGRTRDDGLVAIKQLRGTTARARARFVREVDMAQRVASQYTARVVDADVTGDRLYIVSEFVEGPSLQHIVEDRGPLSSAQLTALALRTASALAAIHRAGVVHRDLKPGNVLLGPSGAKVIDFGVARMAAYGEPVTTHPMGTPAYMAPEQFDNEPPGAAADVFAWAATLTYAATGRPPFGSGPAAVIMRRIRSSAPDLRGLPDPLRRIAANCLAKDPRDRPTAAALVRILRRERRDGFTRPLARPSRSRPAPSRHFGRLMLIATAGVIVLGFVVGLLVPVGG